MRHTLKPDRNIRGIFAFKRPTLGYAILIYLIVTIFLLRTFHQLGNTGYPKEPHEAKIAQP